MGVFVSRSSLSAAQAVGSLFFAGGQSISTSPTVRISRTGAMDIGASGEFTFEMWIRPSSTAADNGTNPAEGSSYSATYSNIIVDGDSLSTRGFIIGLGAGRILLGVNNTSGGYTLIGTTDLRDGAWHHVAVQYTVSSGLMEVFADGDEEDSFTQGGGAVDYDGDAPTTDSYFYLAKEKLEFDANVRGFRGDISMIRISDTRRYTGTTYTVPTSALVDDANTVGLYYFDEGSGTVLGDSSGNNFDGELIQSPTWSTQDPF